MGRTDPYLHAHLRVGINRCKNHLEKKQKILYSNYIFKLIKQTKWFCLKKQERSRFVPIFTVGDHLRHGLFLD